MDYKLLSEQVKYNEKVYEQKTEHAMQSDVIVPDFLPDIRKIVFVNSCAMVKQKGCGADHASVEGDLVCDILYMPEHMSALRCLKTTIPFNHSFTNTNTDENSTAIVRVNILHSEVRLVNSRKINIKAVVLIEISCYKETILTISSDFEGENLPIQTDKQEFTMFMTDSVSEKSFFLEEELKLPQLRYPIETLLYTSCKMITNDIKAVNGKIVVKASALLKALYTINSETGQTEIAEYEIPFSQIMDLPQSNSEASSDVIFNIKSMEITPREDEEGLMRVMDARIGLEMDVVSSSNHTFEGLHDVFGLNEKILIDTMEATNGRLICDTKGQVTLKDTVSFEAGEQIDKVILINCACVLDESEVYDKTIHVNGMVYADILCKNTADNEHTDIKRQLKLNYTQPLSSDDPAPSAEVNAVISSVSFNLNMAGEIELRVICEIRVREQTSQKFQIITGVKTGEKLGNANSTDIIICYPQDDDTLWSIAKKYSVKLSEIAKVNNLSGNDIDPNSILIIPCQKS